MQNACAQAVLRLGERNLLRAEHYLHLRCEIATPDVVEIFDLLHSHPLVRLCSLMDHTPGQRQWHDVSHWRRFREHSGWLSDETLDTILADLRAMQTRYADHNRREIVARCEALSIPLASHDDASAQQVHQAKSEGVALAEFPTTHVAARTARALGIGIVMGAPNLLRGRSHSGNVSALDLARDGLVDVLSSDYVPASLLGAAFELARHADWTLPRAVATVSATPERYAGLVDRGAIEVGLRDDFCRVDATGDLPVVRESLVKGARVA